MQDLEAFRLSCLQLAATLLRRHAPPGQYLGSTIEPTIEGVVEGAKKLMEFVAPAKVEPAKKAVRRAR